MDDPVFKDTRIIITSADDSGYSGFIYNKVFHRTLNELEEFRHSPKFPLYNGGPVDQDHIYFIHQRPDLVKEGTLITGNIYFSGNFQAAIKSINNGDITTSDIKLFIGYCGWDAGDLESEITEGCWEILNSRSASIFD